MRTLEMSWRAALRRSKLCNRRDASCWTQLVSAAAAAVFALLLAFGAAPLATAGDTDGGGQPNESDGGNSPPFVVASTAWSGAFAEAAGAEVEILAPAELRHPPEYDFSPRDIARATRADWLVWGGYEAFMERLFEAAEFPEDRILQVSTNNAPPLMAAEVEKLAEALGTTEAFEEWEEALREVTELISLGLDASFLPGSRAVVNSHQEEFVRWLGIEVVGVFGPAELTPGQLRNLLAEEPDLVIDNWHNALGEPLGREVGTYYSLINFPGREGTETLLDVLRYNAEELGIIE